MEVLGPPILAPLVANAGEPICLTEPPILERKVDCFLSSSVFCFSTASPTFLVATIKLNSPLSCLAYLTFPLCNPSVAFSNL